MNIELNLYLISGDSFGQTWTISNPSANDPTTPGTPVDLTGCHAEMVIEALYNVSPVYSLSDTQASANGGTIALGGTAGTIAISIPAADTEGFANGAYSLRVTFADGSVQTFASGSIFITREIE